MKYFGTDGIRNKAHILIDEKIGYYIGKSLKRFKQNKKAVFIARDTRESGERIVSDIKQGLLESGIDVYDLGVFPTPVLAYFSLTKKTYGFMVTASHNPYNDNGIKIFDSGEKLLSKYEILVEEVIDKDFLVENADTTGVEKTYDQPMKQYLSLYDGLLKPMDMKLCLDLANGAATATAPIIFKELVSELVLLANHPDGHNINLNCGSTHLESLQAAVLENNCDLGIAFDGDADRLMVVDSEGEVLDGDFLIYLFAGYLKANKQLDHKLVALSKMCNIGIVKALAEKDIDVIQTDVGDKYITRALNENSGVLGGESSGHIINKRLFKTGDGVLNAVFLLNVLDYYKISLSRLKSQVVYYPDKLVNLRNIDKKLANHPEIQKMIGKYLNILGEDGKILVRPSGTEDMIRVSASAPTVAQVDDIIDAIANKLKSLDEEGK